MLVPEPPALTQLERITPSVYEASIDCLAKAAWFAYGRRGVIPEHPAAILGTSFHAVVAAAHRGELLVASSSDRTSGRQLFDVTAQSLYMQTHPLVRLKFVTLERLPFYNMQRERAVHLAARIAFSRLSAGNSSLGGTTATSTTLQQTESRLCSADGLIIGRPDHLDGQLQAVIDYKSGHAAEIDAVSDSETRQLRLYAYLAVENGIQVSKGVIIRGDGRRCEIPISPSDAQTEAANARNRLQMLNTALSAGARFNDLASPSSQACRSCPCIPFCEPFWRAADPGWDSEYGLHAEGQVLQAQSRELQGVSLTTFILAVRCGTVPSHRVSVEQVPNEWMLLDGGVLPRSGDLIRVVQGRLAGTDGSTALVRVDKVLTSVWRIPSRQRAMPN